MGLWDDTPSCVRSKQRAQIENRVCPSSLKELAKQHHAWVEEQGWHNKSPLEHLALIASEVGESVNECRGRVPTDKLGEELADVILRVCDLAVEQGIDIWDECLKKYAKNQAKGKKPGRVF